MKQPPLADSNICYIFTQVFKNDDYGKEVIPCRNTDV